MEPTDSHDQCSAKPDARHTNLTPATSHDVIHALYASDEAWAEAARADAYFIDELHHKTRIAVKAAKEYLKG